MSGIISSICVFCGSRLGNDPIYADAAHELGTALARRGIDLVYGGGNVGLMGVVAGAAIAAGGRVVGIIPNFLLGQEIKPSQGTTDFLSSPNYTLIRVSDMFERKRKMMERVDAVIALPGGFGTYDELFEAVTIHQISGRGSQSPKPMPTALINVNNYFTPFFSMVQTAIAEGFGDEARWQSFTIARTVEEALGQLIDGQPSRHPFATALPTNGHGRPVNGALKLQPQP